MLTERKTSSLIWGVLKIASWLGQNVHLIPVLFLALGWLIAHPSFYALILLIPALLSSIVGIGYSIAFHAFRQIGAIYYDFCWRFSGCKLDEFDIHQYVGQAPLNKSLKAEASGDITEEFIDVRIFNVHRRSDNKVISRPFAYFTGPGISKVFLFVRGVPSDFQKPFRKFVVLHELGHANADTQSLVMPFTLGLWTFLWLPFWIIVNLEPHNFSEIAIELILLILVIAPYLLNLSRSRWLFYEATADYFALRQIPLEDGKKILHELFEKNLLFDSKATQKENELRKQLFKTALQNQQLGMPPNFGSLARLFGTPHWQVVAGIGAILLIRIGMQLRPLSFGSFLGNLIIFSVVPIGIMVTLLLIAKNGVKLIDTTLDQMKNDGSLPNNPILKRLQPVLCFLLKIKVSSIL